MSNIYKGQTDFILSVETGIDISTATSGKIYMQSPSGDKMQKSASISGTKLIYYGTAGGFNQAGTWQLQAWVLISGLENWGAITQINIASNLS